MKIRLTLEVSDEYRKAINHRYGDTGMAKRQEVIEHIQATLNGDEETLVWDMQCNNDDRDVSTGRKR